MLIYYLIKMKSIINNLSIYNKLIKVYIDISKKIEED